MREGRPRKLHNSLPQDTIAQVRESAFTRRTFYHRFVKEDATGLEERTFYRAMMGAPARDAYIRDIEVAVDTYIREPRAVMERIMEEMSSGKESVTLSLAECGTLLALLKAL